MFKSLILVCCCLFLMCMPVFGDNETPEAVELIGYIRQERLGPYSTAYLIYVPKPAGDKNYHIVVGNPNLDLELNKFSLGTAKVVVKGYKGSRNFKSYILIFEVRLAEERKK